MWNNVDPSSSKNMTGKTLSMGSQFVIVTAITLFIIPSCSQSAISNKRLCFDPKCSEPVALAKTVSKYHSNHPEILSFDVNKDVKIFSKSAGIRTDLWGVEIDGKRGYAPTSFLREKKVLHKELIYEVPTENFIPKASETEPQNHENQISANAINTQSIPVSTVDSSSQPAVVESIENSLSSADSQVSPSFEVIDGTTIHFLLKEETEKEKKSKQEENYATHIMQSVASATEQPSLTVHPNLSANELKLSSDLTPEIEILPSGISQELPAESVSSAEIPQPTSTLESPTSIADVTVSTEPKASTLPSTTAESTETPEPEAKLPVKELAPENQAELDNDKKIFNSNISAEISTNETATNIEEPLAPLEQHDITEEIPQQLVDEIIEQTQAVEQDPQVPEQQTVEESPSTIEQTSEKPKLEDDSSPPSPSDNEQVNDKVEPIGATDILVNAFDRVTSLFDVLSTTMAPSPAQEVEATTETPVEETNNKLENSAQSEHNDVPINSLNNQLLQEELNVDNIEDASEIADIDNINNDDNNSNNNDTIKTSESIDNQTINDLSSEDGQPGIYQGDESAGFSPNTIINPNTNFDEFPANRNLLNVKSDSFKDNRDEAEVTSDDQFIPAGHEVIPAVVNSTELPEEVSVTTEPTKPDDSIDMIDIEQVILPADVCNADNSCDNNEQTPGILEEEDESTFDEDDTVLVDAFISGQNYWETLSYLALTAVTTLLFSLGYYYIENTRRDGQLIAKINKLEKELLIASKECTVLDETLKSTKTKLNSVEDESFGSNETVASLKANLEETCQVKQELEEQVATLEKDLESATEAGLELERMLREILVSKGVENPLAKSVDDLQTRLKAQQSANESLTNTLHLKNQENEALSSELATTAQKCEQLEVEITRINEELKLVKDGKDIIVQSLSKQVEQLGRQTKDLSAERITLRKQLKGREMEIKDLLEVVKQSNISNIDFEKLSDVSQVKAEASQLMEERDELKNKLNELEGAHHLLEEHMKIINEEIVSITEQCKLAEKEKNEAETRLQVLSKFFKEKEDERQKEEAVWLQQQGEVSITGERLHTMQNEIKNYKQQIETLKREILDQEREYKIQMTNLESKSHEQWVLARQSERRLEESKAEAGQLRNRLTLIEKNLNDPETDIKGHRLETNGDSATSPQLFIGAEASSSPIMFTGSSNIPPPYLPYGPPLPPFLPPHLHASSNMTGGYDVGQRPPPLGGRLSSPPPTPSSSTHLPPPPVGSRYDRSDSGPPSPPISPSLLPPFGHYRSHPPPPLPFPNDRIHPPPPMPLLPPGHLPNSSWGDDKISSRNNGSFHPFHRDQHSRDYKGSLESSVESLDKPHRSGKS